MSPEEMPEFSRKGITIPWELVARWTVILAGYLLLGVHAKITHDKQDDVDKSFKQYKLERARHDAEVEEIIKKCAAGNRERETR